MRPNLLILIATLGLGGPAQAGDAPTVRWSHPWVPERYFDYRHSSWRTVRESDIPVLIEGLTERISYAADGSIERATRMVMRVREPESLPLAWHVVTRDAVRATEIVDLDITWEAGGVTRVYGEADLIPEGRTPFSDYFTDDVGLYLPLDRSRPGTLSIAVTTRDGPLEGFTTYIGGVDFVQPGIFTKQRTLILEVPPGEALRFEERFFSWKDPPEPEVTDAGTRYTFQFATLGGWLTEPRMPHALDTFPSLAWSNLANWEELSAMSWAQYAPRLDSSGAMDAWAAELVVGHDTIAGKALAIHDAVADGWDYLGFYPAQSGWIPHPATVCYAARVGDCKDKATLMIALMRSVGVEAWPAVVGAGTPYALPSIPTRRFNHVIVAVVDPDADGGLFFLDSVDAGIGSRPVGPWLQDRDALLLQPAGGRLVHIPPTPPERWLEADDTVIVLASDGSATATLRWRFVGHRGNRRLAERGRSSPAEWARSLRRAILGAWPGAELVSLDEGPDPEAPVDAWLVTATLRSDQLATVAGRDVVIQPPWLHTRRPSQMRVNAGRRVHPVVLEPLLQRSRISVALPDGATVVALPAPLDEEREDWRARLDATAADGVVSVSLEVVEHAGPMEPGLEEARRNAAHGIVEAQARPIIVRLP